MRQFQITVHDQRVVVSEQASTLRMYDVSANVDGEIWRYRVNKRAGVKLPTGWRERGYRQAYYHAKNSGTIVKFNEVHYVKPKRKTKRHEKQLPLFS